jgi:hypothetical protein
MRWPPAWKLVSKGLVGELDNSCGSIIVRCCGKKLVAEAWE